MYYTIPTNVLQAFSPLSASAAVGKLRRKSADPCSTANSPMSKYMGEKNFKYGCMVARIATAAGQPHNDGGRRFQNVSTTSPMISQCGSTPC